MPPNFDFSGASRTLNLALFMCLNAQMLPSFNLGFQLFVFSPSVFSCALPCPHATPRLLVYSVSYLLMPLQYHIPSFLMLGNRVLINGFHTQLSYSLVGVDIHLFIRI
jgi:hypothetical protein